MRELEGRVAVVTGAASGIGLGLAQRLGANGMKVVLSDIDETALHVAVEKVRADGAEAVGVLCDVRFEDQVAELADRTVREFGAAHVICNNAGVDSGAPFSEIPLAVWDWVLDVNLRGVLYGCRAFLPLIREAGEGHIVNTSSMAALTGMLPTATPYVASKYAVLGLSENLAHELSTAEPQIGVSVLCPAFVQSQMPQSERNRPPGVPALDDHPKRRPIVDFARDRVAVGLSAATVADEVIDAIREQRFWVLPNGDAGVRATQARLEWMGGGPPPAPLPGRPSL